uniref:Copper type II ascorbate-dependent monooxygenase C-terminal domain-containing protein n=1 Tax=Phaselicystis flava TaxID=525924 RepID=A0A3S5GYI2_9BACT|nr:hypothetical protein [Phaselicystis flava]
MVASLHSVRAAGFSLLVFLVGCGGAVVVDGEPDDTSSTGSSSSSSSNSSSSGGPDIPGEWTTLIDGTWELAAGTEGYWCARKTFPEDLYIKAFRALAPPGTHHTLLLRDGGQPDGEQACGPTLGSNMFYASGVGTDDLVFPDGIAVKIPAGTQLQLNLHLFNTSTSPLSGVSGTLVKLVPASEVKQSAEMILPGTASISVPPFGTQTVEGDCAFPAASTISTVWPHMHKYGTHMKVTYEGAGGSKVLHDGAFTFGEQKNYAIEPLLVGPGEVIRIECSYKNTTGQTINWGDSSEAEMCFAGIYRYPALKQACQ